MLLLLQTILSERSGAQEGLPHQCEDRPPTEQPVPVPELPEPVTLGCSAVVGLSPSTRQVFDDGDPKSGRDKGSGLLSWRYLIDKFDILN